MSAKSIGPSNTRRRLLTDPDFRGLVITSSFGIGLALIALASVVFDTGRIIFGDLPGIYTSGSPNDVWFGSLSIYALLQWLSVAIAPPALGSNLLFAITFAVPAIGIYVFLRSVYVRPVPATACACVSGTLVNPVFISSFLGGSFEYGFWVMFYFFALSFLVRIEKDGSPWKSASLAALMIVLGSCQCIWYSDFAGTSLIVGCPLVLLFFVHSLYRNKSTPISKVKAVLVFLTTLLVGLAVLLNYTLSEVVSVGSNSAQSSIVSHYVAGAVAYTYRPYGWASALFGGSPVATYSGYAVLIPISWFLVSSLAIFGIGLTLFRLRSEADPVGIFFSFNYLLAALILVGVASGVLAPLIIQVKLFNSLDSPFFFVFMELLSIPYLLAKGLNGISELIPLASRSLTPRDGIATNPQGARLQSFFRHGNKSDRYAGVVAVGVAILTVALAAPSLSNLNTQLMSSPNLNGQSPFAPDTYYSELTHWYASDAAGRDGQILPIPLTYASYTQIEAYIPFSRLWVIPFLGPAVLEGYNVTSLVATMRLAQSDDPEGFATAIGLAGVRFVIMMPASSSITLVPSYLGVSPIVVPTEAMNSMLSNPTAFNRSFVGQGFTVYTDLDYVETNWTGTNVVVPASTNTSHSTRVENLLAGSSFEDWTGYLNSSIIRNSNGSATLTVNGSRTIPYVVLTSDIPLLTASVPRNASARSSIYNTSNFEEGSYTVFLNLTVSAGSSFDAYVYWYNVSTPPGFFNTSQTTTLGTFQPGAYHCSINFTSVPALLARLVFFAYPQGPRSVGVVSLGFPGLIGSTVTEDLSGNTTIQLQAYDAMNSAGVSSSGSLFLPTPLNTTVTNPIVIGVSILDVYPASFFLSGDIHLFSLGGANASFIGFSAQSVLFLTGINADPTSEPVSLSWDGGRNWTETNVSKGYFLTAFRTVQAVNPQNTFIELGSNITLGLVGFYYTSNQSPGRIVVPLPIGTLTLERTVSVYHLERTFVESLIDRYGGSIVNVLPLIVLFCVLGAVWIYSPGRLRPYPLRRKSDVD